MVVTMSVPYCCRLTPVQTNWGLTAVMPIVTIGPWSSSAWYDGQLPSSLWGHFTKYYRWDIYVIFSSVWWNLYFQQYLYLYAENSILTRSDWDDTKINKKTEICIFALGGFGRKRFPPLCYVLGIIRISCLVIFYFMCWMLTILSVTSSQVFFNRKSFSSNHQFPLF